MPPPPTPSPSAAPTPAPTYPPSLLPTPAPSPIPPDNASYAPNSTLATRGAPDDASGTPPRASLRLWKRAHFSSHASRDAAFLERYLGLQIATNATFAGHGRDGPRHARYECARAITLEALGYEVHLIESRVTPTGNISTDDWTHYWNCLLYTSPCPRDRG